jgi:hypothetical protein
MIKDLLVSLMPITLLVVAEKFTANNFWRV